MSRIDEALLSALRLLPDKPSDKAGRNEKKRYSEKVSQVVALTFAEELRTRGLRGARPSPPGVLDASGAERRMAGGIGAKKVDVTWSTEESGLLFGASIKTINFRDTRTGNFQKNLTNRRGDMLIEAVTLHRRFPYAVLAGFFFLDVCASTDGTTTRRSTFENAHARFKLFTGRADPSDRDEQYERLYLLLMEATQDHSSVQAYEVGNHKQPVELESIFDDLVSLVAERNPDFYEAQSGSLKSLSERTRRSPEASDDDDLE